MNDLANSFFGLFTASYIRKELAGSLGVLFLAFPFRIIVILIPHRFYHQKRQIRAHSYGQKLKQLTLRGHEPRNILNSIGFG